jgi:hypothetical protein
MATNITEYFYECKCDCGNIVFELPHEPGEIARCFCSICKKLASSNYMSFAKYDITFINIHKLSENVKMYNYTPVAIRAFCDKCNKHIYMYYKSSPNIWINTDLFKFSHNHIKTYDIYTNDKN